MVKQGQAIALCSEASRGLPWCGFWCDRVCLQQCCGGMPALLQCVEESLFEFGGAAGDEPGLVAVS